MTADNPPVSEGWSYDENGEVFESLSSRSVAMVLMEERWLERCRLIAAAPELLAAAKAIVLTLHARPDIAARLGPQEIAEVQALCDAINKATGAQP